MRFYAGSPLHVIDELGHLPLQAEAASALFQVVAQRYLNPRLVRSRGGPGAEHFDSTTEAGKRQRMYEALDEELPSEVRSYAVPQSQFHVA